LQSTHDGHFVFVPDVVGTVFNWARPIPLVSISEDGKALPKPFVYPDILASSLVNASFTPSAVKTINGEKATDYLENWAQYGSLQDRDALYAPSKAPTCSARNFQTSRPGSLEK
jgi:hypothetical protein